jgi:hydroxyacylglutathione hydrolase
MSIVRVVSEGLAHFSYFIANEGQASVIDPRRDCDVYLDLARKAGVLITRVFETHRNEDYVVGSLELFERTGAEIFHGPGLDWGYGTTLSDGQRFPLGELELIALRTPGHTEESMSYVLYEDQSRFNAAAVFTGDALFAGEAGRTDLLGPDQTARLAGLLYDSIHNRILTLGDGTLLFPAHGAGSVCGGDISAREFTTVGIEKQSSPLLRLDKRDFVEHKINERLDRPPYFRRMETMNKSKRSTINGLPDPSPMPPKSFAAARSRGAIIVDTRAPESFAGAHIEGAESIWMDGLAAYAGWLLPYDSPLLLVVEHPVHIEKAVRTLNRLGFDNILGYLGGGMVRWCQEDMPFKSLRTASVEELKLMLDTNDRVMVLDPRPHNEWTKNHLSEARHIFVGELEANLAQVPKDWLIASMCSVGHRGGMAAAILQRNGYENVVNILGGLSAWTAAGYPVTKGD